MSTLLYSKHRLHIRGSIRPAKWDQTFPDIYIPTIHEPGFLVAPSWFHCRAPVATARCPILSLPGSWLLCGPGIALRDAGVAAGKGPSGCQLGCQLGWTQEIVFFFTTFLAGRSRESYFSYQIWLGPATLSYIIFCLRCARLVEAINTRAHLQWERICHDLSYSLTQQWS